MPRNILLPAALSFWALLSVVTLLASNLNPYGLPLQNLDKALHFTLFFLGGGLIAFNRIPHRLTFALIIWAIGSEYLQTLAGARVFSYLDIAYNLVGALTGLGISTWAKHKYQMPLRANIKTASYKS